MSDLRRNSNRNSGKTPMTTKDEIARLKSVLEDPGTKRSSPISRRTRKRKRTVRRIFNTNVKRKVQMNPKKAILLALVTVLTFSLAIFFLDITAGEYYYTVETIGEPAGKGLPEFITDEMVVALFETQTRYGIPVSTGLSMIIAEGGFGNFGPGGEEGRGLSQLSYEHRNLFGIKYWEGMEYATGAVNMLTAEQMECGQEYHYEGDFAVFNSYRDAIFKRAWMLMRSPYIDHIAMHINPNDGTFTVEQANSFMYGIRAGGWATDLEYVEKNIGHMEAFELYRFDNMTFDEFWDGR